jgi:hypothetical protein
MSESIKSTPYHDSLESKAISPDTAQINRRHENEQSCVSLKVKVDLKDKNAYMPVALHPTEVVKKAREFQSDMQPYRFVDDSIQSSAKDSNFFDPSPSFRQPDFPY